MSECLIFFDASLWKNINHSSRLIRHARRQTSLSGSCKNATPRSQGVSRSRCRACRSLYLGASGSAGRMDKSTYPINANLRAEPASNAVDQRRFVRSRRRGDHSRFLPLLFVRSDPGFTLSGAPKMHTCSSSVFSERNRHRGRMCAFRTNTEMYRCRPIDVTSECFP